MTAHEHNNQSVPCSNQIKNKRYNECEKRLGDRGWDKGALSSPALSSPKFEVSLERQRATAYMTRQTFSGRNDRVQIYAFQPKNYLFGDEHRRIIQAGMEATSTVSRVPGTPSKHAVINNILIGPLINWNDKPIPESPGFTAADFHIDLFSPTSGNLRIRSTATSIGTEASFEHYHIQPTSGNSFELWDTYEWQDDTGLSW